MRSIPICVVAAVVALAALTAGCSSGNKGVNKLNCPVSVIPPDLDLLAEFPPSGGNTPEDAHFGVKVVSVNSTCDREDQGIVINTRTLFDVVRNDKDLRKRDVTYFVALADEKLRVVAKQTFTLHVEFGIRQNAVRLVDETTEHLPVPHPYLGNRYAVMVGLQLTPEQLDFNRKHDSQ